MNVILNPIHTVSPPRQYPYLGVYHPQHLSTYEPFIVFFTRSGVGFKLHTTKPDWISSWVETEFEVYNGVVTLSNS